MILIRRVIDPPCDAGVEERDDVISPTDRKAEPAFIDGDIVDTT